MAARSGPCGGAAAAWPDRFLFDRTTPAASALIRPLTSLMLQATGGVGHLARRNRRCGRRNLCWARVSRPCPRRRNHRFIDRTAMRLPDDDPLALLFAEDIDKKWPTELQTAGRAMIAIDQRVSVDQFAVGG